MPYLTNTWYVAAWDDELKPGQLLRRTFLEQDILLLRDRQGAVSALQNRCPHRFASLHLGNFDGTTLQCGYHGLRFNIGGTCIASPHGAVPNSARVRAYPLIERHSMLWIWMGEPDKARASLIPDFSFQDPDQAFVGKDYLHVNASYLLEVDNILDLSHTEFLHASTLGSGSISEGHYESKQQGSVVWSNRLTQAEIMTDELCDAMGVPRGAPVDRWINVRWDAPANMALFAGAVVTGRPHSEGRETPTVHCFTPEGERASHYWFGIAFSKLIGPQAEVMAREQIKYLRGPFEMEDLPMLEQQQRNIGSADLLSLKPLLLACDAGAVRARRVLEKMITAEQA